MVKKEEQYLSTLYYKHKCIKTNKEIYLWLYPKPEYKRFKNYLYKDHSIYFTLKDLNSKIIKYGNNRNNGDEDDGKITKNGYYKGIKLCGNVQVVDSFPDFRVQVVDSFPDLKVQKVDYYFPNDIGQWKFVDSFPDFKIQYVDSFPDFKIQFVDSFPGVY